MVTKASGHVTSVGSSSLLNEASADMVARTQQGVLIKPKLGGQIGGVGPLRPEIIHRLLLIYCNRLRLRIKAH